MLIEEVRAKPHLIFGVEKRRGKCPSCGQKAQFTYTGTQQWPRLVALKTGMPELVRLWSCDSCSTTLSEIDLLFESLVRPE